MTKKSFGKIMFEIIDEVDVLLLVLDARLPLETRNELIENKIRQTNKPLIYVINKADLVSKEFLEKTKKKLQQLTKSPVVFVSSTKRQGSKILRTELSKIRKKQKKDKIHIGILGYPNVGKSSVVNLLKGKSVARTSWQSGFTKGKQYVRLSKTMVIFDTPGILDSDDEVLLGIINAKDFDQIDDPYFVAKKIFEIASKNLIRCYGLDKSLAIDEILNQVAIKFNKVIKGGSPDLEFAAKKIIKDWQRGIIKP